MIDGYRTVAGVSSARIRRKRSRFESIVGPVESMDEVEAGLERLRKVHHGASHVCSAYRLRGKEDPIEGGDDNGEPTGSAGLPMLQQLQRLDLLDTLAVVVRHYGGVNLGVGGLVRAYGDAVSAALEEAQIVDRHIETTIAVSFSPELTSAVMGVIHRHGAKVQSIEYDAQARVLVALPPSRVSGFVDGVREASGSRATTEVAD